jgi:ornithine decarboxylase
MAPNSNHNELEDLFDAEENASILADVFKENNVYLGGSAIGIGFRRSARYYLETIAPRKFAMMTDGTTDESLLDPSEPNLPPEDPFYVFDLGVVVYQYYNWCRHFPRVQPYYAVKCNPDPVVIKTLALLGSNFDCASRQEIQLVRELTKDLPQKPDIIYANPCKARAHIVEALRAGVSLMTFDNEDEVKKCASISKKIKLILRIITDDTGAISRLSLKFGAPRTHWKKLLATAKQYGIEVVGISFHVGSGCKDAKKYELALRDARDLFDMAKNEFGFNMHILDIGGGFPGETHSLWNPELRDATTKDDKEDDEEDKHDFKSEKRDGSDDGSTDEESDSRPVLFFNEIAEQVAPILDDLFPADSGIQLISEPGRYLVASCATLLCNVTSVRKNIIDTKKEKVIPYSDQEAAEALAGLTREEEGEIVHGQGESDSLLFRDMMKEIKHVSQRYARQSLSQQEVDVYSDRIDLSAAMNLSIGSFDDEDAPILLPSTEEEAKKRPTEHTAEGMSTAIIDECIEEEEGNEEDVTFEEKRERSQSHDFQALTSAGEAAVAGAVLEAVASIMPGSDDFAYYINDGVYGAFNCIMFDHAVVRPRLLRRGGRHKAKHHRVRSASLSNGFEELQSSGSDSEDDKKEDVTLYSSTVFGPSCDSIDVVSRSVLLPKLNIGDWLYFNNMGAYTSAAASSFNGFEPSAKFYVCSVRPENFEKMLAGPDVEEDQ